MAKIVLLEFIDEFEDFERVTKEKHLKIDDFLIVALEPVLQSYLQKRNIAYENTLLYFDSNSHRDILVESEKFMTYIRNNFHFTDKNSLKKCYLEDYALFIRVFTNHILKLLIIIRNVYRHHQPIELYGSICNNVSDDPNISKDERYSGILAQRFAQANGLTFCNINKNPTKTQIAGEKTYLILLLENIFLKITIRLLKSNKSILVPQVWGGLDKLIADLSNNEGKDILFLSLGSKDSVFKNLIYNILKFLQLLFARKNKRYARINLQHFNYSLQDKEKKDLLQQLDILRREDGKRLFVYNGVSYQDLCIRKVEIALKPYILSLLSASYALAYIFRNFKRSLVISHAGIGNIGVAAELAGLIGKKSLFVSHGTHPVPVDFYHELELSNLCRTFMLGAFTDVALSTPVQEEHLHYFKKKYSNIKNNEIRTGPLIFSSVNGKDKALYKKELNIPQDMIVLTYSVTTKPRHSNRFYFLETLDEFLSSITDIINVVDKFDNTTLILRLHPWYSFLTNEVTLKNEDIKALLPSSNKYIIHRTGAFTPVLAATDILLNYSSTTIDEALINKIPVLLYDKWNRYNHFLTGVFVDERSPDIFPVCYVNDPCKLKSALEFIIKKIKFTKKENIDVSKYAYSENYYNNFINFINESFPQKAIGLEREVI